MYANKSTSELFKSGVTDEWWFRNYYSDSSTLVKALRHNGGGRPANYAIGVVPCFCL